MSTLPFGYDSSSVSVQQRYRQEMQQKSKKILLKCLCSVLETISNAYKNTYYIQMLWGVKDLTKFCALIFEMSLMNLASWLYLGNILPATYLYYPRCSYVFL
jgi:hypothetical protein